MTILTPLPVARTVLVPKSGPDSRSPVRVRLLWEHSFWVGCPTELGSGFHQSHRIKRSIRSVRILRADFGSYIDLLKSFRSVIHMTEAGSGYTSPGRVGGKQTRATSLHGRLENEQLLALRERSDRDASPEGRSLHVGHYGRGHRGLAIEFDSAALSSAVLGHHSIQGGALLQGE
jgi:hypothetical protein